MGKFYSKQGQELKDLENREKEALRTLLEQPDTQEVLLTHDEALFPLFKRYSTQDRKQEIGEKHIPGDDANLAMSCNEFLKFSR